MIDSTVMSALTRPLSPTHRIITEPSDVPLITSVQENGFASPSPVCHIDQVALLKGGGLPSVEVVHLQGWSTDSCLYHQLHLTRDY